MLNLAVDNSQDLLPEPKKKNNHYVRKRALKRKPGYEPFSDSHIKYVWAAYRRGFLEAIEPGLSAEEFRLKLLGWAKQVIENNGDVFVLTGKTPFGEIPVGIVAFKCETPPSAKMQFQPHVDWLPEASPRNKLECWMKFLVDLKKQGSVLFVTKEKDWKFFEHLSKYGVIRPVGKIRGYYSDDSDAMLFQERK